MDMQEVLDLLGRATRAMLISGLAFYLLMHATATISHFAAPP
ncbi:hypothetical protein [Desertibaculum subflavum]